MVKYSYINMLEKQSNIRQITPSNIDKSLYLDIIEKV